MRHEARLRRLEQAEDAGSHLCVKIEGVPAGCDCRGACVLDGKPDVLRVHLDAQGGSNRSFSVLLEPPDTTQ